MYYHRDIKVQQDQGGWLFPGKELSGTVLVPQLPKPIGKLHAILEGISKVEIEVGRGQHKATYSNWVPLFFEQHPLQQVEDRVWKFSISVPERVTPVRDIVELKRKYADEYAERTRSNWDNDWPLVKEEIGLWHNNPDQYLPPSFSNRIYMFNKVLSGDVEYSLSIVEMIPKGGASSRKSLFKGFRSLKGQSKEQEDPSQTCQPVVAVKRVLTLPGSDERNPLFSLKPGGTSVLHSSLSYWPKEPGAEKQGIFSRRKDSSPAQTLELGVIVPECLRPGEPFDVVTLVRIPSGTPRESVEIQFKSLKIQLRRNTRVRVRFGGGKTGTNSAVVSVFDEKYNLSAQEPPSWETTSGFEGTKSQLQKMVKTSVGPLLAGFVQSFGTFNFNCYYSLNVNLSLLCNGEERKFESETAVLMSAGSPDKVHKGGTVTVEREAGSGAVGTGLIALQVGALLSDALS